MTRNVTLAAVYLTLAASAHAQATTSEGSAKGAQLPRVYAMYAPKPDYPLGVRARRIEGAGVFLLHIRPDGTVQSVESYRSTGHAELDDLAKAAFLKWRFRPGSPAELKIPIAFSLRGPH